MEIREFRNMDLEVTYSGICALSLVVVTRSRLGWNRRGPRLSVEGRYPWWPSLTLQLDVLLLGVNDRKWDGKWMNDWTNMWGDRWTSISPTRLCMTVGVWVHLLKVAYCEWFAIDWVFHTISVSSVYTHNLCSVLRQSKLIDVIQEDCKPVNLVTRSMNDGLCATGSRLKWSESWVLRDLLVTPYHLQLILCVVYGSCRWRMNVQIQMETNE